MSIFYNKKELSDLFKSEPITIDELAEVYQYNFKNNFGYNFSLFFSTYENNVNLILEHENFSKPFFNIFINEIDRIVINNNMKYLLIFKNEENEPFIKLNFLPNFSLEIN